MTSSSHHPHILPVHRPLLHQIGQNALSRTVLRQQYARAGQGESLRVGRVAGKNNPGTMIGEIYGEIAPTCQNR